MSGSKISTSVQHSATHVHLHQHRAHHLEGRGCPRIVLVQEWNTTTCTMVPIVVDCGVPAQTSPCPYQIAATATAHPVQVAAPGAEMGHDKSMLVGILIPVSCAVLVALLFLCSWIRSGGCSCRWLRHRGGKNDDAELANVRTSKYNTNRSRELTPPRLIPTPSLPQGGQPPIERAPSRSSQAGIVGLTQGANIVPLAHDHGNILGPRYVGILGVASYPFSPQSGRPLRPRENDLRIPENRNAVVLLPESPQEQPMRNSQARWSSSEQTLRDSMASRDGFYVGEQNQQAGTSNGEIDRSGIRDLQN